MLTSPALIASCTALMMTEMIWTVDMLIGKSSAI